MSKRNTKTKNSEPAKQPQINAAGLAKSVGAAADTKSGPALGVAVLALGDAGEILAARDACRAVFDWEPSELIGRNVRVLLKDGLDNEVGRFLHRHREGKNPAGTIEMNVQALRRDGREFPAMVTTLTFNSDTTGTNKGDTSRLCWTAAFRDLSTDTQLLQRKPADVNASAVVAPIKPEAAAIAATVPVPATAATAVPAKSNALVATGAGQRLTATSSKPAKPESTPTAKPVAAFEVPQQIGELQEQLTKTAAELAAAKTENEKLGCRESELQVQLDTAKEAIGHTEAALREETTRREKLEERLQNLSERLRLEQAERSQRFEEELVGLRKERDELNNRLATEQQSTNESTRRTQELEASLSRNAAEFAHAKAELERQSAERQRSESSWREQLDTAWIAKKELEGAWAGAVERNKLFEEELAKLRREHDELTQKLEAEQKAATDSKQRAKEVESRLNRNAADSDRARNELEKENAERKRADFEWREQLDAAKAIKARLETSLAEASDRAKHLEDELGELRRQRDELQNRVQSEQTSTGGSGQSGEELQRRLDQQTAEVERLAAELEKQRAEYQQAETLASEHEQSAQARSKKLEADWAGAVERNVQLEEELVGLRAERDELNQKLVAERQVTAEVEQLRAASERQIAEQKRADAAWRDQLEASTSLKTRLESSLAEATQRTKSLEEEVAELFRERDELQNRAKMDQESISESSRRAEELQHRLNQHAAELQRASAELEQQRSEQEQAGKLSREQREAAHALARKLEADWTAAVERNVRFEEELVKLRGERDQLAIQVKAEQRTASQASLQAEDLQRRLDRNAAELQRLAAESAKKRSDRERTETEWREQLEAAKALARKLDAAWTAATERSRRFEGEAAALRQEREELRGNLAMAQREMAQLTARKHQLETQLVETTKQLDGANSLKPEKPVHTTNGESKDTRGTHRKDSPQSNGHGHRASATESSTKASPAGPAQSTATHATNGKRADGDHSAEGESASGRGGQLQQYDFSGPSASPARSDAPSRKRLQP